MQLIRFIYRKYIIHYQLFILERWEIAEVFFFTAPKTGNKYVVSRSLLLFGRTSIVFIYF
jgi:hypothetical protein